MLLEKIQTVKTKLGKSQMTSGDAFKVVIKYNGRQATMVFNDNFKNESDKRDFIMCLALDAQAYEYANDAKDFMLEYGYEDLQQAKKIYSECEKQYKKLHRLFNGEEIKELYELASEY